MTLINWLLNPKIHVKIKKKTIFMVFFNMLKRANIIYF
jgi:hypothetical protein